MNISKVIARILEKVDEIENDYDLIDHMKEAKELRTQVRFYQLGEENKYPEEWKKYSLIMDDEYHEYLRLKEKFKPLETVDVYLQRCGDSKVQIVKMLKEFFSCDLKEAKEFADSVPIKICSGIAYDIAEKIKEDFEVLGATIIFLRKL